MGAHDAKNANDAKAAKKRGPQPPSLIKNSTVLCARLNRIPDLSVLLFDHVGSVVDLEGSEDI